MRVYLKTLIFLSICSLTSVSTLAQVGAENILDSETKVLNEYTNGYADTWAWVGPDGHEYAILQPTEGTSIADLDAATPTEINFLPAEAGSWHDVKTYKNYAYAVSDQGNQGLQIIDMSTLPDFVSTTKTWFGDGGGNALSQVHNLYMDTVNAMLYATGRSTQGVHFISLEDPLNPVTLNKITGETHDMCISPDGNMLVQATGSSNSLAFWNITDKKDPVFLTSINIGSGYSHQCWFHDDGIHMATTIETANTKVKFWDVSPTLEGKEPILLDEWIDDPAVIVHNVHYEGDVLYVAYYTKGLWILDVRDHSNVKAIAHHDISTSNDTYGGTWGAYPWLPSGRVLHTDAQRGLQIIVPDPAIVPNSGYWEVPINQNSKPYQSFGVKGVSGNNLVINLVQEGNYNGTIYNSKGKSIYSFPLSGKGEQKHTVQGAELGSGNYFLNLNNGSQSFNEKFIVKK